jgi:CBS domain containing-hemolysin-like protein
MHQALLLGAAFALVLLNGFFVAAEFALVKVRRTRLIELADAGSFRARVASGLTTHLDAYLSATQLGITLASIGLGWIGEPAVARLLEPGMDLLGVGPGAARHAVSFTVAFVIISFLHIVLGELAPKSLAIRRPEAASLWVALPLRTFYYVLYPAIALLNGAANLILRKLGIAPASEGDEAHSGEELQMILASSHAHGLVNSTARRIMDNALEFAERRIVEIMVPRPDMVTLSLDRPLAENLAQALSRGHSRYPLVAGSAGEVVGMVHVKDLLRLSAPGNTSSLASVKRAPLFIPETASLDRALRTLQRQRTLLAVVVDEYGTPSGLITMEDILEQLVGDIEDEFDAARRQKRLPRDVVDGHEPIAVLERRFGIKPPEGERVHTVAGAVLASLGRVPRVGDRVALDGRTLEVTVMDGRRIARVRVLPRPAAQAKPGAPAA